MGADQLLWIGLALLASWSAPTHGSVPNDCSRLRCDRAEECRLRHKCHDTTSVTDSYLPPCWDYPECVPTVSCAGFACRPGHRCKLEADPAPTAAEYRPPLQRAACRKTLSCDELRCPAGEHCVQREVCEHSLKGYLPPCETIYECGPKTGKRAEVERSGKVKVQDGVEGTKSSAEVTSSDSQNGNGRTEDISSDAQVTKSRAEATKSRTEVTKSRAEVTKSRAEAIKFDVDKAGGGVGEIPSGKADTMGIVKAANGGKTRIEGVKPLIAGKAVDVSTSSTEQAQLFDSLLQVVQATQSPTLLPDVETTQLFGHAKWGSSSEIPLGELEKVLLEDAEVGAALSAFSSAAGLADRPANEQDPVVLTVKGQTPKPAVTPKSKSAAESVSATESISDPTPVGNVDPDTALVPDTLAGQSGRVAPDTERVAFSEAAPVDEGASKSQGSPVPASDSFREPPPAPKLAVAPESFSDIIVLTPEALGTPESTPAFKSLLDPIVPPFSEADSSESLVARRSVGLRTCTSVRCAAGRRCVLQNNRPMCKRQTCKDFTCKKGSRCVIMGGVPVCQTPTGSRQTAPGRLRSGASCEELQCNEDQKCVLAGGKAWCARRRTCARLRCRYDQHCQVRRGLPRCAIRRSCDGVSCTDGKVCQLIGRLPRCVVAPQCQDLNCGPIERCISVRGVPTCLTAPPCYDRRCPPRQECRIVGEEHMCVDTPTCKDLRCRQGRVCRKYFGAAKCITATTCANTRCRHDQKCVVKDHLARCVPLKGAPCADDGTCEEGLECRPVNDKPTCVKPATCEGFSCSAGQRCAILSGTPTCVASCAAANCASDLFCRVNVDRAVCVECELDCPTGQICKLQEPRRVTSEYVVSKKKIPQCVTEEA